MVSNGTGSWEIKINGEINVPYTVQFEAKINDDVIPGNNNPKTKVSFINNASTEDKDTKPITTNNTITSTYGPGLSKENGNYDFKNQIFSWKINYNQNGREMPAGSTLTDTFNKDLPNSKLKLDENSFHVYKTSYDDKGTLVVDKNQELVKGTDYDLVYTPNQGFKVVFKNKLDYGVQIQYDTPVDEKVIEGKEYTNDVESENEPYHDEGKGKTTPGNIIKHDNGFNHSNRTTTYTIDINQNEYEMSKPSKLEHITVTDNLGKGQVIDNQVRNPMPTKNNLDLIKVVNKTTGDTLEPGKDYVVADTSKDGEDAKTGTQFKITFINNYETFSDYLQITYPSAYYKEANPGPNGELTNHTTFDFSVDNTDVTNEGKTNTPPEPPFNNNGFKESSYNYDKKLINWTVGVNYAQTGYKDAKLEDDVTEASPNQKLLFDSMKVYSYKINPNGTYTLDKSTEYPFTTTGTKPAANGNLDISLDPTNPNKFIVLFPDSDKYDGKVFAFNFDTKPDQEDGNVIQEKYKNIAHYTDGYTGDTTDLEAEQEIFNGNKVVRKTGSQQADGSMAYRVLINPTGSTISDVTFKDTSGKNLIVDTSSIVINGAKIAADGKATIDPNIVMPKEDYTVVYNQDGNNENLLTIKFNKTFRDADNIPMKDRYFISYRSMVVLYDKVRDTAKNTGDLEFTNKPNDTEGQTNTTTVNKNTGTGIMVGNGVNFYIQKKDDTGKLLPGISFQLYDSQNKVKYGGSKITGNNGQAFFGNIAVGTYYLREISTLPGHTIPTDLITGRKISVTGKKDQKVMIDVVNPRSKVQFTKKGDNGLGTKKNLQGVTFKLSQDIEGNGNYVAKTGYDKLVSDKNGVVNAVGLEYGAYMFEETATVKGYIKSTIKWYFWLDENTKTGGYDLYVSNTSTKPDKPQANNKFPDISNYQGVVKFHKLGIKKRGTEVIESKDLAEAEFVVEDRNTGSRVSAFVQTDKDGNGVIAGLAPGQYTLVESGAPFGYVLDKSNRFDFDIDAQTDQDNPIIINAKPENGESFENQMGKVAIRKIGKAGDRLEGTLFELYDLGETGKAVQCPAPGSTDSDLYQETMETGSNGVAGALNLWAGHDFCIREIKASPGYILNSEEIKFSVPTEANNPEELFVGLHITNNMGRLMINKKDVQNRIINGAEFGIYSVDDQGKETPFKENIIVNKKDFIVDDIPVGNYVLKETKAPKGYVKTNEEFDFSVKETQEDEWVIEDLPNNRFQYTAKSKKPHNAFDVTNFLGKVSIEKFDEKHAALDGATFNILDSNGKIFKSNITTKDGRVDIDNIPVGTYKVVETKAPKGYHINNATHTFTVENKVDKDNNPIPVSVEIVNYPTKVVVNKVDQDGKGLRDASFKIEDTKGNVVVKEFKMSDSKHVLDKLETGNYKLIETKAPKNYRLESKPINFTIPKAVKGQPKEIVVKAKNVLLPGKAPQTGNDNLVKWIALTIASLLLTIFGFYYRNREHN